MIALDKSRLTVWADTIGIPNLTLAEHDLRLTHALAGLYAAPALKGVMAFKGGTALNKIYFGKFSRLSVDLDFNLIGAPSEVVKQGAPIRKIIEAVLREQDPGYEFKFGYRADQTTLLARYAPQSGWVGTYVGDSWCITERRLHRARSRVGGQAEAPGRRVLSAETAMEIGSSLA